MSVWVRVDQIWSICTICWNWRSMYPYPEFVQIACSGSAYNNLQYVKYSGVALPGLSYWWNFWFVLCRGFTKFARVDYVKWKEENRLVHDGVTAKVINAWLRLLCGSMSFGVVSRSIDFTFSKVSLLILFWQMDYSGTGAIIVLVAHISCLLLWQLLGSKGRLSNRQPGKLFSMLQLQHGSNS